MPRVTHVKSARKDNPVCKAGEPYYWWKFRYGGKHYSLTYPKQSQLTQSAYLGNIYDLSDQLGGINISGNEYEGDEVGLKLEEAKSDAKMQLEEVQGSIQEAGEECQESLDNMPEQLQYAPTGELLQERIDACECVDQEIDSAVNEIDSVELDYSSVEVVDDDARNDALEAALEEIQEFVNNVDIDQAAV